MSFNNISFAQDYPVPDPATSFFISPTGNDTLGNGTEENPYRTFTRAYRGLTAWRAANGGSTAHGYLIALDGVYDYKNQNSYQNYDSPSTALGLMNPEILQNVTLMSKNPLGAKVNYLIEASPTDEVFNLKQSNEYRKYRIPLDGAGLTFSLVRAKSNVGLVGGGTIAQPFHLFFGGYDPIVNGSNIEWRLDSRTPTEVAVTVANSSQLPSLATNDVIAYPAIYKYAPPSDPEELAVWEEANWTANQGQFSLRRTDNHQFALGLTYDFVYIPELGRTGAWVRQRDDLLRDGDRPEGVAGNTYWLENTQNPPKFLKDILLDIEDQYPGISWSNNVVAFVGGNSNLSVSRVVRVEAENGRMLVERPPTWFDSSRYWLGTTYAENDGSGQPTNSIAFINHRFINRPGQFAFEDGGIFYFKNFEGNTELPKVRSNNMILHPFLLTQGGGMVQGVVDGSNATNFTKNVVIAGFSLSGCDSGVKILSSGSGANNNLKAPTNVKITCNLVHDTLNGPGIGIGAGYGKIEVSNNFILRGDDRALYVNRVINAHPFWKLDEPTLFYNNTCYNWRRGAGIMHQGCKGVRTIANKLYAVGRVAHGDGMAIYAFSNDVEVRDNYVYTPNLLGVAVNDLYRGADAVPLRFINNIVYGGLIFRDSDSISGSIFENNTFGINNVDGHPRVFRTPTNSTTDPWWNTSKHKFRNNVILSTTDWVAMAGSTLNDGNSYTVFIGNTTWPFDTQFTDTANKLRGPSGPWHTYFAHNYIAGDGLPNWYNNIAPTLYQFDRITGAAGVQIGIKYPYSETNTYIVNNDPVYRPAFSSTYSGWPAQIGMQGTFTDAEGLALYTQMRADLIYSRLFVDYPKGNLNIKSGVTAYDGTLIPSGIGTSLPYTPSEVTDNITDSEFEDRISDFWKVQSSTGVISNPPPVPNHPITINLSTTDITEDVTWLTKNGVDGHSGDGIFPSDNILKIPNIMDLISVYSNPGGDPEIGPSTDEEMAGSCGGGVQIISESDSNRNYTLSSTTVGSKNDLNITTQVKDFMGLGKANGGQTMSLIIHGQVDPSETRGEFKTIIGSDTESVLDDFYKSNSYIAFNSSSFPSPFGGTITTNNLSFRKHPHHVYVNFIPSASDLFGIKDFGLTTDIYFGDELSAQTVRNNLIAKVNSLQVPPGTTCTINEYSSEITNATRTATASTPATISAFTRTYLFDGFTFTNAPSGIMRLTTTTTPYALFTGLTTKNVLYYHSHPTIINQSVVGAAIPQLFGTIYAIRPQDGLPQKMAFRLKIPPNLGSKNLLAYQIKSQTAPRLFGGTNNNNIGIDVGSYIRISGSSFNDGIYKVLSIQDGIDGDTPSNTINNGGTEFQYLELSRSITPEVRDSVTQTNITIENVSHLPILHIKYKTVE